MSRFIAFFLSLSILFIPVQPVMAQASRYRLPTQADQQNTGPAPSFRGGERMPMQIPQGSSGLGTGTGIQLPAGGAGAAMGSGDMGGLGGAAMLGMGYQVHVLGEVMRPGTYKIAASDRVSEVIQRAGGLAESGSGRNVEIKRKGGGVIHIDLLNYQLFGKLEDNPFLTDNDVVYVPLREKIIQVVGAVKRPDFYELKKEKTLEDVVNLSGGFNAATNVKEPIRIVRFTGGEKEVKEVPIDKIEMEQFEVYNGDVIVVPNLVTKDTKFDYNVASIPGDQIFYPSYEDRVFVLGGVAFPGAYPFSPYYTANQYISLAGGITDKGIEGKYKVIGIDGKSKKIRGDDRVNPGDTVMIKERALRAIEWTAFGMSIASFGLATATTVLALTKR